MPFSVEEHDNGFDLLLTKLSTLGRGDFRTAFRRISRAWLAEINEGFLFARDPYGTPWEKLKESTIAEKTRKGSSYPTEPLRDTDEMRQSFHAEVNRTGFLITSDRVFEDGGTPDIHQFGGVVASSNTFVPARPMVPLEGFPPHWVDIAEGYLMQDFDQAMQNARA